MEIQAGVFETVPECEVNCAPNALFPLQFLFCSVNKSNSTRFKLVYKKKKKTKKNPPIFQCFQTSLWVLRQPSGGSWGFESFSDRLIIVIGLQLASKPQRAVRYRIPDDLIQKVQTVIKIQISYESESNPFHFQCNGNYSSVSTAPSPDMKLRETETDL